MTTNMPFVQKRQFLSETAAITSQFQELVDILQKIVQNAGELLEVRSCSVALIDSTGTVLITMATLQGNKQKPRHTRFRMNEGVAGWVAKHRVPLVINNAELDPRFKRLGRIPVGSIMCVPLIDQGTFIGTLTASSQEIDAFDEKKARLLTIFAEQAVLAIVNARQAEMEHHQADQLEMLIHLSRNITMHLEPEALYRTILTDVRRLIVCESATIYLYHERLQKLQAVANWSSDVEAYPHEGHVLVTGDPAMPQEEISLHDSQALPVWAAVHRHPMLCGPMQSLQHDGMKTGLLWHLAEMSIPFVSKEVLYGVLSLKRKEAFNSEELRLMRNLGNMVAAALENVELFHAVRSEREELRAILAASSDGVALLDESGYIIEANESFGSLFFGIDPRDLVGEDCLELLQCHEGDEKEGSTDRKKVRDALRQMMPLPSAEIDLVIQDIPRSFSLSITPVSAAREPVCLLVARDVTAIRDAARMKANFLSMITHELRSPINAINGYLDLALTGIAGELNEQQREFMRRARSGSEHLYALVEDLLLVSRADSGVLHLNREIIQLQEVITNAVEEMELTAEDAGVTIDIDIARGFPRLYADAVRLQQVLRNLISNALRFTPRGGHVTVSARLERNALIADNEDEEQQTVVKLCVSDTGCGIAPEYHKRIFERFYQIPGGQNGRSSGQGLGLAIVKMIIELHKGTVAIDSTPGQGSTFICTLPCLLS